MATHYSNLDWKIPWTEEPGGLQFPRSKRVRHDWACVHTCACAHTHTRSHTSYQQGCFLSQELWEKSHSLPIPESKGHLASLAHDPPSSIFKARKGRVGPCYVTSLWPCLLPHLPHLRTRDYWLHWIYLENLG